MKFGRLCGLDIKRRVMPATSPEKVSVAGSDRSSASVDHSGSSISHSSSTKGSAYVFGVWELVEDGTHWKVFRNSESGLVCTFAPAELIQQLLDSVVLPPLTLGADRVTPHSFEFCHEKLVHNLQQPYAEALPSHPPVVAIVLHDIMSAFECESVVSQSESFGFGRCPESPKIRTAERVIVWSSCLATLLFARILPYLSDVLIKETATQSPAGILPDMTPGLWVPCGINPCFRVCKYFPNGFFLPHYDGGYSCTRRERSIKTLMIYLSEDFEGGPTCFFQESQRHYRQPNPAKIVFQFQPKVGSCLLFNHCLTHDGGSVHDGVKYILRTEVMYKLAT